MHQEQETWQSFKRGNRQALAIIFKNHYSDLHNYGLRISGNDALTEDCLQDFFLYLFEHRENLADLDNIRPYLFKSFRRMLLRQLNKSKKIDFSTSPIDIPIPDIQFTEEDFMIEQETLKIQNSILLEMLNNLPKRQREVIYLKYYNNLNIKEIEEIMAISYQGVVNKLHRAIKALKRSPNLKSLVKYMSFLTLFFLS